MALPQGQSWWRRQAQHPPGPGRRLERKGTQQRHPTPFLQHTAPTGLKALRDQLTACLSCPCTMGLLGPGHTPHLAELTSGTPLPSNSSRAWHFPSQPPSQAPCCNDREGSMTTHLWAHPSHLLTRAPACLQPWSHCACPHPKGPWHGQDGSTMSPPQRALAWPGRQHGLAFGKGFVYISSSGAWEPGEGAQEEGL